MPYSKGLSFGIKVVGFGVIHFLWVPKFCQLSLRATTPTEGLWIGMMHRQKMFLIGEFDQKLIWPSTLLAILFKETVCQNKKKIDGRKFVSTVTILLVLVACCKWNFKKKLDEFVQYIHISWQILQNWTYQFWENRSCSIKIRLMLLQYCIKYTVCSH